MKPIENEYEIFDKEMVQIEEFLKQAAKISQFRAQELLSTQV